jgi:hypothetical protein
LQLILSQPCLMLNRQLLLLALALWAACAGAAPLPRIATFPSAAQVYTSEEPGGGLAVLAPNAAVLKAGAAAVGPLLTGLATPEDCAAACRAANSCSWFDFCQTPVRGQPEGSCASCNLRSGSQMGLWLSATELPPVPCTQFSLAILHLVCATSTICSQHHSWECLCVCRMGARKAHNS